MALEGGIGKSGLESVGRYQKSLRIGEGSYGIVYLATDRLTGEQVALKRFNDQIGRQQDPLAYGKWEWALLNKIQHPNIVAAKQLVASDSHSVFMVYEYCEHDLHSIIGTQKYPYTEDKVKGILSQILTGIDHMHHCGFMHRDVKAANILMNKHGIIKLCDFSSASSISLEDASTSNGKGIEGHTPNVTTRFYSAPEVLLGSETYNEKCDSWAVGCIMAELLRSEHLFPGESDLEMISLWTNLLGSPHYAWKGFARLPGVAVLRPLGRKDDQIAKEFWDLSETGQDLLRRLLTFDPEKRLSAKQALQHAYFKEDPMPVEPFMLELTPSTLETKAHQRRKGVKQIANAFGKERDKRKQTETAETSLDADHKQRRHHSPQALLAKP